MYESKMRSLCKAITYRVLASVFAFLLALYYLGDVIEAVSVVIMYYAGSIAIYYIHERLWERIKWGRRG